MAAKCRIGPYARNFGQCRTKSCDIVNSLANTLPSKVELLGTCLEIDDNLIGKVLRPTKQTTDSSNTWSNNQRRRVTRVRNVENETKFCDDNEDVHFLKLNNRKTIAWDNDDIIVFIL